MTRRRKATQHSALRTQHFSTLLFSASHERRVLRDWVAEDVMIEPVEVVLQDGTVRFRLRDRMAEPGIENEASRDSRVAQPAIELERVRRRDTLVAVPMLNQRRRSCL